MKKFLFGVIFLITCVTCLFGCEVEVSKSFKTSISENTFGLASSMDGKFKVDYKWGEREEPYASDGKTMPLVEYGVITVTSLTGKLQNHTLSYSILIDNKTFEGDFLINPYDQTFVIDLKFVPKQTTDFKINVTNNNIVYDYVLINVLKQGDADCNEAIKIAKQTLEPVLKEKLTKDENFEIYVRLINSQNKDFKPCWYVSIYTTKSQLFAVAIDPSSKIVLARKI